MGAIRILISLLRPALYAGDLGRAFWDYVRIALGSDLGMSGIGYGMVCGPTAVGSHSRVSGGFDFDCGCVSVGFCLGWLDMG